MATIEGKGRLTKDKTIKIRMDALEIHVLDGVSNSLGYAERATTIRWLIKHYPDIAAAKIIKDKFQAARDAEAGLQAVL